MGCSGPSCRQGSGRRLSTVASESSTTGGRPTEGASVEGIPSAGVMEAASAELGRGRSTIGSRNRKASTLEGPQCGGGGGGGGGGGMENISLTASVEVTVVNGIPGGGDGSSSRGRQGGDGGDSDEIFCSYEDSRGRLSSTVERKHQLPRGSTVNSIRGADVEHSGAGENEEGDAVHDVERRPSPNQSSVSTVPAFGKAREELDLASGISGVLK